MGKIQELSEQLANQIAAGEVVERPASVVKELMENAIDASGTQIDILIEEAGLKKIQVVDNGEGIAKDDVPNAFKRHATSKIHTRDDLFRIRSLGFRGEALPSISSVSEVTLETAVSNETEGSFIYLKGGKIMEHRSSTLRKGTKIVVSNLFFNTPARLKYVKTIQTELASIGDIVNRLALSHPNIAFSLTHDGNKMMHTTGKGELKQTIAGIYGVSIAKKMITIQAKDLDFSLTGYISLPEVTRASRNYLSIIVNGRYIKNFILSKAILEGYGSKLMVGRYPIAILEISIDPLLIDVNVHPTKQEVRLSKEKELVQLVHQAIHEALSQEQLIPNAVENLTFKKKIEKPDKVEQLNLSSFEKEQAKNSSLPSSKKSDIIHYDKETGNFYVGEKPGTYPTGTFKEKIEQAKKITAKPSGENNEGKNIANLLKNEIPLTNKIKSSHLTLSGNNENKKEELQSNETKNEFALLSKNQDLQKTETISTNELFADETMTITVDESMDENYFSEKHATHLGNINNKNSIKTIHTEQETTETLNQKNRFPDLEYFGQMHGTYLFAQGSDGLYILDQHAAQERINYEYFRKKIGEVTDDLQELLVPLIIDYPNTDVLKIKEKKDKLKDVGIYLEDFDQNSFIVRSHPTWYPSGEEESIIREMIDILLTTGNISVKKFREETAIMMSCKQAIKANHFLNEKQARSLLEKLATCENPFNCPHGRPVLVHFTNSDMEKMFKRIQDPH
ncbi:DNA mismatch repair endonuclease MutL [Melissococcus plutonius]|uniref:DNA mismatch repair endonuclease MutL n=1 Tax=Melissococcus plutonius TaxID=33970 RepID=UPI003EE4F245